MQVGAGSALLSMARSTLARRPPAALVSIAAVEARRRRSQFAAALVELAVQGLPVDLRPLAEGAPGTWLPSHPLVTEPYRVVTKKPDNERHAPPASAPAANDCSGRPVPRADGVLQAQVEIIKRQNEALGASGPAPLPRPNPVPNPIPNPVPNPATVTAAVSVPLAVRAPVPPPAATGVGGSVLTSL